MPQKLTTTACFIQEESSGGENHLKIPLGETGCSGKFLRHFYDYTFRSVYTSLSTAFVFRKPKLSRLYMIYIYIYIYIIYIYIYISNEIVLVCEILKMSAQ